MFSKNVIRKIPGDIPPPPKKESQGYIDDLGKKQKFQLEELLERQKKILANKKFISKLPDKGEKIISFHDKILEELKLRNEIEEAANLLSRLNIASEGKAAMSKLEWTGKYNDNEDTTKIVELDSDDDEEDPLKILAQPTGTGVHKKKIIHVTHEESLIKPEDIAEIESFKTDPLDIEHVKYIVDKVEKAQETNKKKEPFKPYKTTKSNVHDPAKEKLRKLHKNWEVTAATPPLIVHGAVKILTLNESLKLQKEQTEKLQEIQAKHAVERLANQIGLHSVGLIPQNIDNYRSHTNDLSSSSSSSDNEEEHEVHDEEDNDKGGTVVFTVDSIEN
ncbi:DNA-directed RNA polymerase II subunit GRINL1A [Pogonomyrmex barbatus]|uniref:DNA-directed RNA polymerase II subunit GRINL1A n=1 Tax=Pogonomyrmex barbatus TaxID=144034 RepID=A0A6I9W7N5_9HYME|nr:DNA-directed RNA polymerase II subunit GRINL1A [Pogonomyrmex barbatus]XP_011638097.1 DNA-directed RNA polymerase II subunit GRINL1A [Pogonomyrmex barbatus]XP_011638098.1 DNA-directed RNA polymerase II subunit GRINL1A [Pogonomyrmex barbatus]XP_011638099.1 DNA-directed RNA polymerase II subunit GRINL1A [Pogonomyrmex barbatus]XP_011638100.1 DNA-directed RNA polymerase II subunit GRINL1A [Pogonomyrmex barbatus]XP_011638101.1 DNA-directed RNA polymerase II subunit GRINL1A [Pogonomyrmex barbatus]